MGKFAVEFTSLFAINLVPLGGIVNFCQKVDDSISPNTDAPRMLSALCISVNTFVTAAVVGMLSRVHLILAVCSQSQVSALIVQGVILVFVINLDFRRGSHDESMHEHFLTILGNNACAHRIEATLSSGLNKPSILGYAR